MIRSVLKSVVLTFLVSLFLFSFALDCHNGLFRNIESTIMLFQGGLLLCIVVWYGVFLLLTFSPIDFWIIYILLTAVGTLYFRQSPSVSDCVILLATVALGRLAKCILMPSYLTKVDFKKFSGCFFKEASRLTRIGHEQSVAQQTAKPCESTTYRAVFDFLIGMVGLLFISLFIRLDMKWTLYNGPRWIGLWENPNTCGMLMGAGISLAAGLQIGINNIKSTTIKLIECFLLIAIIMLGVGLVRSYSRGAWLATSIGLLYLAWCYGKLKWRSVLPGVGIIAMSLLLLWSRTSDSAPWYVKRADFGRPSVQHRFDSWRAGVEIMHDYPWGVGWGGAVSLYEKHYSPPDGGALALTTNDYLMIGTELGVPALLCFVIYVALCFRHSPHIDLSKAFSDSRGNGDRTSLSSVSHHFALKGGHEALRASCLAGALVFIVAFWFDGGLFKLPTAAMFWVLLELGRAEQ